MREIWFICEAKQQMHILSSVYFSYWYTTYHVLILALLIILSGIVYLLDNTNTIPDTAKQYLSISVGILSMISSFVQSLNQQYKYDSGAEIHKNASLGMKKITDQIGFLQVNPTRDDVSKVQLTSGNGPYNNKEDKNKNSEGKETAAPINTGKDNIDIDSETFVLFTQVYHHCLESCQYQIPVKVSQAFNMVESCVYILMLSLLKFRYIFIAIICTKVIIKKRMDAMNLLVIFVVIWQYNMKR